MLVNKNAVVGWRKRNWRLLMRNATLPPSDDRLMSDFCCDLRRCECCDLWAWACDSCEQACEHRSATRTDTTSTDCDYYKTTNWPTAKQKQKVKELINAQLLRKKRRSIWGEDIHTERQRFTSISACLRRSASGIVFEHGKIPMFIER